MEKEMWEWTDQAVEMIPFGLLAGFYGEKELRITSLAEEGFCFRTVEEISNMRSRFRICFYDMERNGYQEIHVKPEGWRLEKQTEFFHSYAVIVNQEDYRTAVRRLFGQYDRYIRLKLEEDDGGLAKALTGYPAEKDEVVADSLADQMQEWFGSDIPMGSGAGIVPQLALELDHPGLYTDYLNQDFEQFLARYCERKGSLTGCFGKQKPDRIYVGNAFCHLLFPDWEKLSAMLERARKEGVSVTVVFSYVRENQLEQTEKLLKKLMAWCGNHHTNLEVEVNDWAMAEMLKNQKKEWIALHTGEVSGEYPLIPVYGRLLNKRRKDPRMAYKKGSLKQLEQNSLNADFYREYLKKEAGIRGFEWESCGYEQQLPPEENHLHLPFYQTNTSQYCTLYAGCRHGDRGRQALVSACDMPCLKLGYLYPDHLGMTGRYNSLFGLDTEILNQTGLAEGDWKKVGEFCRNHHINRLVLPCWP